MAHSMKKHETAMDGPFYEASFVLWFCDVNCFTLAAHAVGYVPRAGGAAVATQRAEYTNCKKWRPTNSETALHRLCLSCID